MKKRRDFIKTTLLVAGGIAVSSPLLAKGDKNCDFDGIVFSKKRQGIWGGKAQSHVPEVKIEGRKVILVTNHGMSEKHYIVRHTLVSEKGEFLGAKTFYPSDVKAESSYILPVGFKGKVYATSFCNKHDFWITSFEV
jgi:superoxide reductase